MNERIKLLAEQAGMYIVDDEFSTYGKFAELIVRECVCLVLNGKHDEEKFDLTNEFHQGWNVALDGTATGIKEHFGVE
jgi:hypothetical protein